MKVSALYNNLVPSEAPLVPSSACRLLRDKVVGVVVSFFRAIQSLCARGPKTDISLYPTLQCIKKARVLSDHAVLAYLTALQGLEIYSSLLIGATVEGNPDAHFVAIPIVLKGLFRNHIVVLLVDKNSHQIEFYDSKGLTVQDQANRKLFQDPSRTLKELINTVWNTFASTPNSRWTFKENTVRHQTDGYNCGVYVSDFVTRRLQGKSFEQIQANGLSFTRANGDFRNEMIQTIIAHNASAPNPDIEWDSD